MKIIQFINDYWPAILAIGAFLDAVSGYLPDKWVRYIGITKRIVNSLRNSVKKK